MSSSSSTTLWLAAGCSAGIAALVLPAMAYATESELPPPAIVDVGVSGPEVSGCKVWFDLVLDDGPGYVKISRTKSTGGSSTLVGYFSSDDAHSSQTVIGTNGVTYSSHYVEVADAPGGAGTYKYAFKVYGQGITENLPSLNATIPSTCVTRGTASK